MPLRGTDHSSKVQQDAPYFKTLEELDLWAATPSKTLSGVLGYKPLRKVDGLESEHRGKLLVCHDYKGGYTESPSALAYTFNFWSYCDTFVYFSHHRVTIPPPGWITASHRQGVRMLGTLIFEGEGEQDCLRLLVGKLPQSKSGQAIPISTTLPVSPHYARVLAELAAQRGFDGYLLNFECPLRGGVEQTRALAAWITILQAELESKVGPHAQAIWYDSVVITGQLAWQDRLNTFNLPFLLSSSGLFTNYTWPVQYPSLTAQYFLSLDPALVGSGTSKRPSKTLQDIWTGVDVWGRGSHGGGGFGSYKAIEHIDPESLGLSVALFGQAWTWESRQDDQGWNWEKFWAYENKLWLGPKVKDEHVEVPEAPLRQGEAPCLSHGKSRPIASFFPMAPAPNPFDLPFHTSFGVGIGRAWFVEGLKVLQTEKGWTDIDKQGTLGNMVWPRPSLAWEGDERSEAIPDASSSLDLEDAWNGGSSLRLAVSGPGSDAEDAFFRCVWLPVQSVAITSRRSYEAHAVYKTDSGSGVDFDLGLSVKLLSPNSQQTVEIKPISSGHASLPNGWATLSIQFDLPADHTDDVLAAIGLVIGFATEDPTESYKFSVTLGQINIFPASPTQVLPHQPRIIWADFDRTSSPSPNDRFSGMLTWEVAAAFPALTPISLTSPEDPNPAWIIDNSNEWFPVFMYFNVYVLVHSSDGSVSAPETATFIGTTGLDGEARRFFVDPKCLPGEATSARGVRFLVQGVTDRGEVLKWNQCVFVDV